MFYSFFPASHKHVCIFTSQHSLDYLHLFYIYRLTCCTCNGCCSCVNCTGVVAVDVLCFCPPLLIFLVNNNKCVTCAAATQSTQSKFGIDAG